MPRHRTLLVRATHPDRPCPMEERRHGPRIDKKTGRCKRMIYSDTPVEVPRSAFYLKRLRAGDLEIVESKPASKPAPKPAPAPKKEG